MQTDMPPALRVNRFLLQKDGCDWWECEDAIAVNREAKLFAVADGATEAFDSRRWARLLAYGWVRQQPPAIDPERFHSWVASLGRRIHARWNRRSLPWYAEEKARGGSFAAFAGLSFEREAGASRWRAVALGDTCLIQLRDGAIHTSLPLSRADDFGAHPTLVPSLDLIQTDALAALRVESGPAETGDVFLLLSDAVAAWYLRAFAGLDHAAVQLDSLLDHSDTDELMLLFDEARGTNQCSNDDIAILRIVVESA